MAAEKAGKDLFRERKRCVQDALTRTWYSTLALYALGELPPEEQKHFRRLQDLTAKQRRDWIDAVRVLDQPRPKNYFFNKSFRVLGDLTDNVYVRVEMMAFWVKQLGRENAVYLETMMSLKFYKQCQLLDKAEAAHYIERRLNRADVKNAQVEVRFQFYVPRTQHNASARVKEVVQDLSSGSYPTWVGANIVGPETGAEQWRNLRADTKPEDFKKHQWSIHAGELDFPNDAVWKAVVTMNASRIGHGVNWLDLEPDLKKKTLQELRQRNILIETNLVSNKVLHTVPSWKDHPLRQFLEFKIPTCLCSDDPGIFGSTLTDEYMLAAEFLHRDSMLEVFIKMGKDSLKHAFVPTTVKQDLIQRFEENVDRFNQLLSCLSMGSCQEKLALIQASYFACHQWPTLCMDMPVFDRLESFLLDVPPLSWWSW